MPPRTERDSPSIRALALVRETRAGVAAG